MKQKFNVFLAVMIVMQIFLSGFVSVNAADEVLPDTDTPAVYEAPESPAVTYNMNIDWKYKKGDGTYPLATALTAVEKDGKNFYEVGYDDSDWDTVSVPHPINAEDSFDDACFDAGEASLYRGFMFYRKNFTVPSEDAGKKFILEFEAVRQSIYLYVNGEMAGYYEAGIAPTGFDITPYIKAGEENLIAVATDNAASRGAAFTTIETKPGSEPGAADGYGYQWNTKDFNEVQGGITGNVNLYAKNKLYQTLPLYNNLKTTGNYIYGSNFDIDNKSATINVKAEIRNETEVDEEITLQVDVVAMDGTLAYSFEETKFVPVASDPDAHFMNMVPADAYDSEPADIDISTIDVTYIEAAFDAQNMRFWSDTDPYMYTVYTILKNSSGEVIDVQKLETGFRKVEYNINDGGLKINDKSVYLKGYAQRATNEWAVVGVANDWLTDIDMQLLKKSNGNHIRWMHVAPKPVATRATDKYGIITVCPAGDKEGDVEGRAWDQRVEAMRDAMIYFRNSPSVLFWEAGNNKITAEHMQEMTDLKQNLDPYGGRYAGCRTLSDVDQINAAEYVGTMLNRHAAGAKASMATANKYMPILETEYARDEAPRRVWDDFSPPDYDYVNKWLGPNGSKTDGYDIWDQTSEDFSVNNVKGYDEFWSGRVGGGGDELYSGAAIMVWSDSNMHNRNTGTENCRTTGKVDAVRIEKDAFYALQAVQSDTPKIHIVGHWNYPELTEDNYWYEEKEFNGTYYVGTGVFKQRNPLKKTVYVIGSPDVKKVELYVNGELVGMDYKPDKTFVYAFPDIDVTQSGEVSAKAYDENEICVAEDIITTAGEPDHIKLTPVTGPAGLIADGSDIMYYDVWVVDENDQVCPLNYDRMDLSVSGEGILLGGYSSGVGEKNTTGKDYTYAECGKNRVFVRSTRNAGTITLTVSMDGLGQFESTITSTAYENSVGEYAGLSTQMQRAYEAGEQPEAVEQKVEAFKTLASAVKADFGEDGNTKVVSEVDNTDYYTITVNGEEVSFTESPYCPGGPTGVMSEVTPVLDALKTAGANIEYTYTKTGERPDYLTDGSLPVVTITSGFKADATIGNGDSVTQLDIVNGDTAAILNRGADKNLMDADTAVTESGELVAELKVMLGYLEGVTAERDETNKVYKITYTASEPTPGGDVTETSISYAGGMLEINAGEEFSDAKVIFAAYDNGRLSCVVTQEITMAAGEKISVAVPETIAAQSGEKKAMLWNSLGNMKAMCSVAAITADEQIMLMEVSEEDMAYSTVQLENNFNTNTQTDGPDGTGYLQSTAADTVVYDGMGTVIQSDSLIELSFRFDSADANLTIRNSRKKYGPIFSYDGTNFRTQTGSSSYQALGAINVGEWYAMEIEGKMGTDGASAAFRLYKYQNGEKVLVQETAGLNLRQFGGSSNGLAETMYASEGISVDNLKITSLYANKVEASALTQEINANESVLLSALATRNGRAVVIPDFAWSLYDENGNALNDPTISVVDSMLVTTKDTATQTVIVRATAQTKGNPYGEVAIKVNSIDTSGDTFNSIELNSDKDYARFGETTIITPNTTMDGEAVTVDAGDITWSVYNESNVREVKNIGITVDNGVVSIGEYVIPQIITVRASNKSGSAIDEIQLEIKPGTMILDGEIGNKDTFVSGNACEEFIDGIDLAENSWDGTGYYKLTDAYSFAGFADNTSENVVYGADMRFDAEGAGWVVWNASGGKQGMQVKYSGGNLGIVGASNKFNSYLSVDQTSWYNVSIMCATGAGENSYGHLIVYKYDENGNRVHPKTGELNTAFIQTWIPMRNLAESPANHITVQAGTSVDNAYCAKTVPDAITVTVDKDTLFAGQSIQGTVTATRQTVPFGNLGTDVIKWVVYDENNENPLGSEFITVDASGKLTVDALADSQTIYLRAATIDGLLYDGVKVTIQSSDIFTVNTIGFNEDYTKVVELDVTKNFSYSDDVTFVVAVYDSTETELKAITTKKMSAKNIARGEEAVAISMDAAMPEEFDKESDVVYIYTMTSVSENSAVTEADGTISAEFDGNAIIFNKLPQFDDSAAVIAMVLTPDAVTTDVNDSDIVYIKEFTGSALSELSKVSVPDATAGEYIIKLAGKVDGLSVINTGNAVK